MEVFNDCSYDMPVAIQGHEILVYKFLGYNDVIMMSHKYELTHTEDF